MQKPSAQQKKPSTKQKKQWKQIHSIKWEEIFANNMTDMGLIFNIYTQLIHFNIKKK